MFRRRWREQPPGLVSWHYSHTQAADTTFIRLITCPDAEQNFLYSVVATGGVAKQEWNGHRIGMFAVSCTLPKFTASLAAMQNLDVKLEGEKVVVVEENVKARAYSLPLFYSLTNVLKALAGTERMRWWQ